MRSASYNKVKENKINSIPTNLGLTCKDEISQEEKIKFKENNLSTTRSGNSYTLNILDNGFTASRNSFDNSITLEVGNNDSHAVSLQGTVRINNVTSLAGVSTTVGKLDNKGSIQILSGKESSNAIVIDALSTADLNNLDQIIIRTTPALAKQGGNIKITAQTDSITKAGNINIMTKVGLTTSALGGDINIKTTSDVASNSASTGNINLDTTAIGTTPIHGKINIKSPNSSPDAIKLEGNVTITGTLTSAATISNFVDLIATGNVRLGDPSAPATGNDTLSINATANINTLSSYPSASILPTSIGNTLAPLTLIGSSIDATGQINLNATGSGSTKIGSTTSGNIILCSPLSIRLLTGSASLTTPGSGSINLVVNGNTPSSSGIDQIYIAGATRINESINQETRINTGTSTGQIYIGNNSSSTTILGTADINATGSGVTTSIGSSSNTVTIKGTSNINVSINQSTNINTGTSTGGVNIGNSASTSTFLGTVNVNTAGISPTSIGNATNTSSVKIESGKQTANAIQLIQTASGNINNINTICIETAGAATNQVGNIALKTTSDNALTKGGNINIITTTGSTTSAIGGNINISTSIGGGTTPIPGDINLTSAGLLSLSGASIKLATIGEPSSITVSNLAIGADGTIYKTGSSMRYKENIKLLENSEFNSEDIYSLSPCAFTYKADKGTCLPEFGLIAEDLEEKGIFLNALRRGPNGEVDNIHYQTIFIAALKELIKLKREFDLLKADYKNLKNNLIN